MHSLDTVLRPASVAVIGASNNPTRIGGRPVRYLREAGFSGMVYPVNPNHTLVQGLRAYPNIDDVPEPVDLVIVAVPAQAVLGTVQACAAKGVKAAIIFSAGFAETNERGRTIQENLRELAICSGMRILGPNCLGAYNAETGFFATFSTTLEDGYPTPGSVGLVSQSGAYGSHLSLLARKRGLGVRYWVTTGNEADISVPEVIGWMVTQPEISVIVAYAEGIANGDMLLDALERARAQRKAVVFMKVGSTQIGALAAQSHTAALAGSDAVYDAALRQFGAYRAHSTDEMLDVAYAASFGLFPKSPRVALVSISGGVGVQMADAAVDFGLTVAPMNDDAQARLKAALPYASPRNPVDITAQAFNRVDLVEQNLDIVLEDDQYDAVVAFFTYVAAADGMVDPIRKALHRAKRRYPGRALVLSIVAPPDIVAQYEKVGCLVFQDPTRAVRAAAALHRFHQIFVETIDPPVLPPITTALPVGPVSEFQANRLFEEAGVSMVKLHVVHSSEDAMRARAAIAGPVAIKASAPGLFHKTEVGGVMLNVTTDEDARRAYDIVIACVQGTDSVARVDGVLVSPMVTGGIETIAGIQRDPTFGPVIMFGLGGLYVEAFQDASFRIAPFTAVEATRMIAETKAGRLLRTTRAGRAWDIDALAAALSQLSLFAASHDNDLDSAEINPLVVLPKGNGVKGLDAVVIVR